VRPESVILVRPEAVRAREGRDETLLRGTIVEELDQGTFHTLFFRLDEIDNPPRHIDLEVELSARVYHLLDIPNKREWTLSIAAEQVHIIGEASLPYFEGPAPQPVVKFH
jgi:hypothetical protein